MKIVLVDNIPHWQDAAVCLPIMAGGQEPGVIGTTGTGGESIFTGVLFNPDGSYFGRLIRISAGPNAGKMAVVELADGGGARLFTGGSFLTSFNEGLTLDDQGRIVSSRDLPFNTGSGGGGSRAAPAFSSTQAAQNQAEAFRAEQDRLQREFQANQDRISLEARAEQNRLAQEAATRRDRLGALTRLIESFVGAQAQARDTLANLQPDAFRFAAVAGGIAPFGVTPQQGFQQQLQQFASAPVPTADPNASLPSIESAIHGLTGATAPLSPQVFGAAGGATIPAPPPGQSIAVKVGEKGEEVLRITAQGVEVIPLSGGMAHGGNIDFPFEPIEFDKESLFPALAPLFQNLGFTRLPTNVPSSPGLPAGTNVPNLKTLGFDPSFVQVGTPRAGQPQRFFIRSPEGTFREVSSHFITGGGRGVFNFPSQENAIRLRTLDELSQFGPIGAGLSTVGVPDFLESFQNPQNISTNPLARFSAPIIEPTTGTLLPSPSQVAGDLNRLRLTNPTAFNLLLSAYDAAGVPATFVLSGIQAALPFGSAGGSIGLR